MSLLLLWGGGGGGGGGPVLPAAWPAHTWIPGTVFTAAQGNAFVRDPQEDIRQGALALSGQEANDFAAFTSSASQLGRVAASSGKIPRFNGTTWEMVHPLELAWPVGSVYKSTIATNPNTVFGFGTWTLFGAGRTTVCVDAGDPDFDTAQETGGSKTHTLTIAELPSHTHTQNSHNHTQDAHDHTVSGIGNSTGDVDTMGADADVKDDAGTMTTNDTTATNIAATAVNQSTGGGGSHPNMPPYIAYYRFGRVS